MTSNGFKPVIYHKRDGGQQTHYVPADATEQDVSDHFAQMAYGDTAPADPVGAIVGALRTFAQNRAVAPPSAVANIGDVTGLGLQGTKAVLDSAHQTDRTIQNSQQMTQQQEAQTLRDKYQQQKMRDDAIEAEKDRQKAFQLEKMRHDNTVNEHTFQLQRDKQRALDKAKIGQVVHPSDGSVGEVYEDPETGERKYRELKPAVAKDSTKYNYDASRGAVVSYGGGAAPSATPVPGLPDKPAAKMSIASQLQLRKVLADVDAPKEEKDMIFQSAMDTGILPNIDIVNKDGTKQYTTVTHEDGSQTLEEKKPDMQIRPPKAATDKDPFQYLQKTFGARWSDGDKQTMANALVNAGFQPEQIQSALGNPDPWGPFGGYTIPPAPTSAAPAAPATPQGGKRGYYTDDNGNKIPGVMLPDGTFQPD